MPKTAAGSVVQEETKHKANSDKSQNRKIERNGTSTRYVEVPLKIGKPSQIPIAVADEVPVNAWTNFRNGITG